MIKFTTPEKISWEFDGTILFFKDLHETEWMEFVKSQNIFTKEILEKADGDSLEAYQLLTPEEREKWDSLDAMFFSRCFIGAENLDPDGMQFDEMEDFHKQDFFKGLQLIPEFRGFWATYYRGKKKVLTQSDLPEES